MIHIFLSPAQEKFANKKCQSQCNTFTHNSKAFLKFLGNIYQPPEFAYTNELAMDNNQAGFVPLNFAKAYDNVN